MLLLAGLSEGTTTIHDLLDSDDTQVMLSALRTLGCRIDAEGDSLHITGLGGRLRVKEASLFLGNAGTAMRPLTAALAMLAATQGGTFDPAACRGCERPIADLIDALRQLGCRIDYLGQAGYPPLGAARFRRARPGSPHPGARRRVQPVPDGVAALPPCRC